MIIATETDKALFNLIAISGICTYEQAAQLFPKDGGYHYKRIQKLVKEGYLIKRGRCLELTKSSSELIGTQKYRFFSDDVRKEHIEVTNIALSGLQIKSNREIRNEFGLNRKTHFKGAIVHEGIYYLFYMLPEQPTKQYISFIKTELKTYSSEGFSRHSVIFVTTTTAMSMFTAEDCKQEELFLLSYPQGLTYLQSYFSPLTQQYLKSFMPRAVKSKSPFANYEDDKYYYTVMTLNDLAKRYYLSSYYKSSVMDRPVKILCLESQVNLFTAIFPKAELIVLSDERFQNPEPVLHLAK